jgi:hypothetical protein
MSWPIKDFRRLIEAVRRLWHRITRKPKLYNIVEYTKYYEYRNPKRPSRDRYLEARAKVWLKKGIDPEKEWDNVESLIDDAMTRLGFDPFYFTKTKVGYEIIGENTIESSPEITVIDKKRGYVWSV